MSAVVEFKNGQNKLIRATIEGYRWTCEDKDIEDLFNGQLDPNGASPSQAQPDIEAAYAMAPLVAGTVVEEIPDSRDVPKGAVI